MPGIIHEQGLNYIISQYPYTKTALLNVARLFVLPNGDHPCHDDTYGDGDANNDDDKALLQPLPVPRPAGPMRSRM